MATQSSILAWRIPGTGEPGGLPSMGSHRVRHDWSDLAAAAAAARFVIAFLPRSKRFLISWLQSPSAVMLEPEKIKSALFPLFPHLFAMKWWDQMPDTCSLSHPRTFALADSPSRASTSSSCMRLTVILQVSAQVLPPRILPNSLDLK